MAKFLVSHDGTRLNLDHVQSSEVEFKAIVAYFGWGTRNMCLIEHCGNLRPSDVHDAIWQAYLAAPDNSQIYVADVIARMQEAKATPC